ncbi:hypothetical protein BH11PAT1_BH11PAT1_1500 [soil metagenome]
MTVMKREDLIQDTVNFYNTESSIYRKKRYPKKITSYVQYLFKRRFIILLSFLENIKNDLPAASLLEIGCADGIIIESIEKRFPDLFTKLVGTDISSEMIHQAKINNSNSKMSFYLRDNLPHYQYNIILELGVHVYNLEEEIKYTNSFLKKNSYFIYSAAGKNSFHTKFKLKGNEYAEGYMSYFDTELILRNHFEIKMSIPYGLFVPKLWALPLIGRILQPVFDFIFLRILPEFFHEKIYLLKLKN